MMGTDRFVAVLDGRGLPRGEAGGKAWALDRLVEHGFPVPTAAVVLATAYREAAAVPVVARFLDGLRRTPIPSPGEAAAAESAVEEVFLTAALPGNLEAAIHRLVVDGLRRAPLAIRSSATAEDLSGHSFAGQYRSHLGIADPAGALRAIRRCWASLWFPAVRAYRLRAGLDDGDLAMAVIVQRQIAADWSGVMFTRDPQGDGTTMRIEVVPGMGEQLVSGRVTPSDHQVDRATLAVTAGRQAPPFLEDVARLGLRIERRFGEPQDIEWVAVDGTVWIVQSRAITVDTAGTAEHGGANDTFTPQGVAEMLPGVLDPLRWSINHRLVEEALRTLLRRSGADVPPLDRPLLARFNGRAALDLTAFGTAVASLGAGDVTARALGDGEASPDGDAPRLRVLVRAWKERRRIEDEVGVLTTAVSCLPLIEPDPATLTAVELIAYRRQLRDLAGRGVLAEVAASAAATTAYRSLEAALCRWVDPVTGAREAQRVTSGGLADRSVGTRRIRTMAAVLADAPPAVRSALAGLTPAGVAAALDAADEGPALAARLLDAAVGFGSISLYAGPTFAEAPDEVWRLAEAAAATAPASPRPAADAIDAVLADRTASPGWRAVRFLTGQFVDVRRRVLHRLAADAVRFLGLREEAKASLLVLGGMEQRVVLAAADRLVRSGHLETAADVGLLEDPELEQMLLGAEPVGRIVLERRRRDLQRARACGPLPASFVGSPDRRPSSGIRTGAIGGWPASPGTATGRVRQLHGLEDGDRLRAGEVIVAVTTDPSWTPLFLRAGAIVLEQGGPLSHAAIVAREVGLPAVLNVADALHRLPEGAEIEVDGTAGTVVVLEVEA